MKTYTITIDFFKEISTRSILTILNSLINPCTINKICIDKQARVLEAYQKTANNDGVNLWITALSDASVVDCTRLDYDFGDDVTDYKIAEMTSLINGARATIAHSLQTVAITLDQNNCVTINNEKIEVIDLNTAENEINNGSDQYYDFNACQISMGNGVVKNCSIK